MDEGVEAEGVSAGALKVANHLRRYMPLYVLGTIWTLMAMMFPNVRPGADAATDGSAFGPPGGAASAARGAAIDGAAGTSAASADVAPGAVGDAGTTGPVSTAATGASPQQASGPAKGTAPAVATGSGTTRAGVACTPGVRQVPVSSYAAPCVAAFAGDNGGATHRGVTGDKILIADRQAPESANSAAVAAISQGAGFADAETARAVRKVWLDYFNSTYELYGRKVELREFESTGDSTAEAQGKGIEAACNDATAITQEMKAYAALGGSIPFSQCAGERGLVVFTAAAYYPESYYQKYHPYLWHTIMECERISIQLAEYIGKRLLNRNAKWAGDPALQATKRKFATYVPDNDGYQRCVNLTEREMKTKYSADPGPRYNYQLDVSRFPDQAAQAVVQFRSEGATSVILACDPISVIFLTQAATNQNFSPEWILLGTALQDTDNFGRSYDQAQVKGHMFGLSQLGATNKVLGPQSEPGRVFKAVTGSDIPAGTDGGYFTMTHLFNMLQAAGPNLNPHTMAAGAQALPPGGAPDFPLGYWSLADSSDGTAGAGDHTQIDDSREVYWDGDATSPADGKKGTFKETYGGKRFRNGEWPAEEPAVYPKG